MPLPAIAGLRPDATLEEVKTKINSLIEEFRQLLLSLDSLNVPSLVASYISTADGTYPRIDFSSSGNILQAYQDALNWIAINPSLTGAPTIKFYDGTDSKTALLSFVVDVFTILTLSGSIQISAQNGDLILKAGNKVKFDAWSYLLNIATNRTLQQDLDAKANASSTSGTVYVSATSGGPANIPITFSGGIRTS